jgi:hypothetical protein
VDAQTEPTAELTTDTGAKDAEPAEQQLEKPVQSLEENAKIAAARREAETRVRAEAEAQIEQAKQAHLDSWIEKQGYVDIFGNPIKTHADYERALAERETQERYRAQGIPDEVIKKLSEVEELKNKPSTFEEREKIQTRKSQMYQDFYSLFKEINGRDFAATDTIPDEVYEIAEKSRTGLRAAYAEYAAKDALSKLKGVDIGKKTAEANAANAASSTGSVSGNGQATGFVTQADIDAHANDTAWMTKNYDAVSKFYRKTKG